MMPNMAIPAMMRLVAIGRRMKFSEMFTPGPLLAPRPSPAPAVSHDDAAARRQAQLPLRDHRLAQLQTLVHDHVLIDAGAGGDGPHLHRPILLHHIDIRTVLAGLDRLVRHYDGVWLGGEPQGDTDKLPRPQLAIGVGKRALQLDG